MEILQINITGSFSLFLRFTKPEILQEVAALEIIRDHSLYYKVRWAMLSVFPSHIVCPLQEWCNPCV